jgi:hypothetical protein
MWREEVDHILYSSSRQGLGGPGGGPADTVQMVGGRCRWLAGFCTLGPTGSSAACDEASWPSRSSLTEAVACRSDGRGWLLED